MYHSHRKYLTGTYFKIKLYMRPEVSENEVYHRFVRAFFCRFYISAVIYISRLYVRIFKKSEPFLYRQYTVCHIVDFILAYLALLRKLTEIFYIALIRHIHVKLCVCSQTCCVLFILCNTLPDKLLDRRPVAYYKSVKSEVLFKQTV